MLDAWLGQVYEVLPCPVCRGPPCQFSDARSFHIFSKYGLCQICQDAYVCAAGVVYAGQYTGRLHGPFHDDVPLVDHQRVFVSRLYTQFRIDSCLCSRLFSEVAHPSRRQTLLTGSAAVEHVPQDSDTDTDSDDDKPLSLIQFRPAAAPAVQPTRAVPRVQAVSVAGSTPSFSNDGTSASASTTPSFSFGSTSASAGSSPSFSFGGTSASAGSTPSFSFSGTSASAGSTPSFSFGGTSALAGSTPAAGPLSLFQFGPAAAPAVQPGG